MEKRVLLAVALSGLVLVVWYALFTPPPVARPPQGGEGVERTTAEAGAHGKGEGQEAAAGEARRPPAEARVEVPEEAVLESDDLRVTVDGAGGVISSIVLKGYRDDEGKPLELVRAGGRRPLEMGSLGAWNQEGHVLRREGDTVALLWSDGEGNWVEKEIALGPGRFGLRVEVRSGGVVGQEGVVIASTGAAAGAKGGYFARLATLVRANGDLERIDAGKIKKSHHFAGVVEFAGVEDQYFLTVLLPEGGVGEVKVVGDGSGGAVLAEGVGGVVRGTLDAGPKDHDLLVGYGRGLDETLSFGIFGIISVAFLAALKWIYSWCGNWGVAIIVLTAALRVVLFPLTHKSTVAMRRMQKVQPKMKAIQERYKERAKKDPQARARMNQEVMALYKQEGVNPMGGCLPLLVQLPILWALYTLFAYAIELRQAPFALWITDLAQKDPTYILPVLMTASMFLQQKLAPQSADPAQRRLFLMMPLIFGFMFLSFPAGLVLYWLVNNVLTIVQQVVTERLLREAPAKG